MRDKYDFDPVSHYAVPDMFSLSIDDWPKHAVISSKIVDADTILKVNFSWLLDFFIVFSVYDFPFNRLTLFRRLPDGETPQIVLLFLMKHCLLC